VRSFQLRLDRGKILVLGIQRMLNTNPTQLWCGVVWCGVVWCGVVWCGVVRYAVNDLKGAVVSRPFQSILEMMQKSHTGLRKL